MNLYDICNQIATIHRKTTADFIISGVDILLPAINSARRKVESLIDLEYSNTTATLAISSDLSGNLDDALLLSDDSAVDVKRIQHVLLPISGGGYVPIEFLTNEQQSDRLKQQTGRRSFDPNLTADEYGIGDASPYCYQFGNILNFGPASQFADAAVSGGFTAQLSIVRFFDDYTQADVGTVSASYRMVTVTDPGILTIRGTLTVDGTSATSLTVTDSQTILTTAAATTTDFILANGWKFLMWEAVLQTNRYFKTFAPKEEGNLDEAVIQQYATEALQEFAAWNASISQGTTAPVQSERRRA